MVPVVLVQAGVLLHLARGSGAAAAPTLKTDPLPSHESLGVLPERFLSTVQIHCFGSMISDQNSDRTLQTFSRWKLYFLLLLTNCD